MTNDYGHKLVHLYLTQQIPGGHKWVASQANPPAIAFCSVLLRTLTPFNSFKFFIIKKF